MSCLTETSVYARELIWRMFRDAADEDYFVARWSAKHNLHFQFYWSAQQSIEKYLKGILLMNGVNTQSFGHDIGALFDRVTEDVGDLVPWLLCPHPSFPRQIALVLHRFEPTVDFIARVNEYGDPGNRYRHYGFTFYGYDLHKYDELCFRLRRLIFPLEMSYIGTPEKYREILSQRPNFQPHDQFRFLSRKKDREHQDFLDILSWRNFSYFEKKARDDGYIHSGIYSMNSEIYMNLERGSDGKEAIEWLIMNAKFSASDRAQLRELLK